MPSTKYSPAPLHADQQPATQVKNRRQLASHTHGQFVQNIIIYTLLIGYSLLLRYPFFPIYQINWDEWTFILLGQDVLNGFLPYTNRWDIKPPLVFYSFAGLLHLFGNSLEGVRLGGALIIGVTSIFVYHIAARSISLLFAITSAIFFILLVTVAAPNLMSEHLALLPMSAALLLLDRHTPFRLFCIGILLSLTLFIRMNLALIPLLIGLYCVFKRYQKTHQYHQALLTGCYLMSGFMVVFIIILFPYLDGQIKLFFDAVFIAPFSYAQVKLSAFDVLFIQITQSPFFYQLAYVFVIVCAMTVFGFRQPKKSITTVWLVLIATEISLLIGGRGFTHYWIQLAPMLSIFTYQALYVLAGLHPLANKSIKYGSFSVILMMPFISVWIADQIKHKDTISRTAQFLSETMTKEDTLYTTNSQILYWLLDKEPLTQAVIHPSNITKPFLLAHMKDTPKTPKDAFIQILNKQPTYIVSNEKPWYLSQHPELMAILSTRLKQDYTPINAINQTVIYQRIDRSNE